MRAGTFDARTDRYVTWAYLAFDRQAWKQVIRELDELAAYVKEEERRSALRLEESDESPICRTLGQPEALVDWLGEEVR